MRGEASRIADRESRDSLAPKLRDTREDAWRIGNELFTITKVLDDSIQLERALTDPSRPVADKVAVLKELLACEVPYCTPGGKPTLVNYSIPEIKRKFGIQA